MRRASALLLALAVAGLTGACGGDNATNSSGGANNATRNGVVETNANVPPNMNNKTAPSNTATVQNNNGNQNTAGVSTTNSTGNAGGGHTNSNH